MVGFLASFPNLEAEIGLALMFASMIPPLPRARLFPFALFLVLGAVTLAWRGFLAWLIWLDTVASLTMRRSRADRRAGFPG